MNQVTTTGLNRVGNPKPNKAGSIIVAFFDCEVNGFSLKGCALARTERNGLTVWPPKLEAQGEARRSIGIADGALRHAMMTAARDAYRALGGTDAKWTGRSAPDFSRIGEGDRAALEGQTVANVATVAGDDGESAEPAAGMFRYLGRAN